MFTTIGLFAGRQQALLWYALAPLGGARALVLVAPALIRCGGRRARRACARWVAQGREARSRGALRPDVFSPPARGLRSRSAMQLGAWALQWLSCYVLLVALGLEHKADLGAAAAILFAVNVTAVLPVTPSNVGVFQAACMAVLVGAYGVSPAQALGYGIILQAVEVATAVIMGAPALVKEGLSWREVRLRAMHTAPVSLSAAPACAGRGQDLSLSGPEMPQTRSMSASRAADRRSASRRSAAWFVCARVVEVVGGRRRAASAAARSARRAGG